jgi:hypothetical protein
MPVSLSAMRGVLMPGVCFMFHAAKPLTLADIPEQFPHLRAVFAAIPMRRVGDLRMLPKRILGGYRTKLVFAGREYPQGWGRGPGGAAAELPPEPDGKANTYRYVDSGKMRALKTEINEFIELRGYER